MIKIADAQANNAVDIPLPAHEARLQLFQISLRNITVADDVNMDALASKTEGYSGADVTNVIIDTHDRSCYNAIRFVAMPP